MTTLKEAQKNGKLEEFIKEREQDKPGDHDQLNKTVKNLALDVRTNDKFTKKGKTTPKG